MWNLRRYHLFTCIYYLYVDHVKLFGLEIVGAFSKSLAE